MKFRPFLWIRYLIQRFRYGCDDRETWNLDHTFAKLMLPRLKRYREIAPRVVKVDEPSEKYEGMSLIQVIDEVIYACEVCLDKDCAYFTLSEKDFERVKRGFELFGKYIRSMWW